MCLVAFAINASSRWPLVIASNRDESLDRPTLPLARWTGSAGLSIVSGRDARAGGAWFGATPDGRIAILTNVREPAPAAQPASTQSRGELVVRWLEGGMDAAGLMDQTDPGAYAGFNLVLGDWTSGNWTWLSNRGAAVEHGAAEAQPAQGPAWCARALRGGIYGLSNAALDTPWPKTVGLKRALDSTLRSAAKVQGERLPDAALWTALADRLPASPADLPATGLTPAFERALSSAFVDAPERRYGTRCSTLLVVAAATDGQRCEVRMTEKTYHRHVDGTSGWTVDSGCTVASESLEWAAQKPL